MYESSGYWLNSMEEKKFWKENWVESIWISSVDWPETRQKCGQSKNREEKNRIFHAIWNFSSKIVEDSSTQFHQSEMFIWHRVTLASNSAHNISESCVMWNITMSQVFAFSYKIKKTTQCILLCVMGCEWFAYNLIESFNFEWHTNVQSRDHLNVQFPNWVVVQWSMSIACLFSSFRFFFMLNVWRVC